MFLATDKLRIRRAIWGFIIHPWTAESSVIEGLRGGTVEQTPSIREGVVVLTFILVEGIY